LRIVHIAPFYHPVIGGVEEVVKKLAEYMANKGNEAYVLTYNRLRREGLGSLPGEETINKVRVVRLKSDVTWSYGTYSTELPEVLKNLRPDIVHVHVWRHPHVFQVAKLKRGSSFKTVLHGHAPFYNMKQLGFATWTYYRLSDLLARRILKMYDAVIALTPYEKRLLVGRLGVEEDRAKVIPNGVDDDLFRRAQNCLLNNSVNATVLYVGRLSKEKNVDLLIRAMYHAVREVKNAELVLAGPDDGSWSKLPAHQEASFARYVGPVDEEAKLRLYASSKIFSNPSTYEGFGLTLLEAQAFGKPCVITGDGGQLYTAPPGKVSLYAKPSPKDFGEAISLLLEDEELYKKLSANAKDWASQHSWSKILFRYDEVYS